MQLLSHAGQEGPLHINLIPYPIFPYQGNERAWLPVCISSDGSADCIGPHRGLACRGAPMHGARSNAAFFEAWKACLWVKESSRCTAGMLHG